LLVLPLSPSLRTLPIVEKWDCQGCGHCCRGTTVVLGEQDLIALREQEWEKHPEFQGVKTVVRERLLGGRRALAKRTDGRCVFLSDEGRCRIHEIHGPEAKPAICRMFPLQLVPLGDFAYLTTRRSCPTAAVDEGRPLSEHLRELKKSGLAGRFSLSAPDPPPIVRGGQRSWRDFLAAADVLARLTSDDRLPMVRRLVHGLSFCSLLGECRVSRVEEKAWAELLECLEASAAEGAGEFFRDRQPPSRSAAFLFRLLAVHYIRSHPGYCLAPGFRQRWRMLGAMARFARGKGAVPPIHEQFPLATFESLETPLGPLSPDVAHPLNRYFETHAASKQYAVVGTRRPLVESFRALAFKYPIALWLLRLASGDREPTTSDMIDIVVALERGHGLTALGRAAMAMASKRELERLIAWYAR
jgi:lysine-N-methylase